MADGNFQKAKSVDEVVNSATGSSHFKLARFVPSRKSCLMTLAAAGVGALVASTGDAAYAQEPGEIVQEVVQTYSLLEGLRDGLLAPINLFIDAFSDKTWAADGTGIASEPHSTGWYNFGWLTAFATVWGGSSKTVYKQITKTVDSRSGRVLSVEKTTYER